MHPILFRLDEIGFALHSYGLCMALGILFGYAALSRLTRARGMPPERLDRLVLIVVVAGLAGARLLYVAEHWSHYASDPGAIFRVWEGGLVFYGCVILGGLSLFACALLTRTPLRALLDLGAVALPIGQAFGRVGCFLNGCCWGRVSHAFWAVRYPRASPPWSDQVYEGLLPRDAACSLPVLPSQLFEAAGCLLLFGLLLRLYVRLHPADRPEPLSGRAPGAVAAAYLAGYGALRFFIETLRSDPRAHPFGGPLTISQAISVGCWIAAAALLAPLLARRFRARARRG